MGNSEQQQLNSSAFSKTQIAPSASIRILKRLKKLEMCLRQQGFNGNSYGLLFEDLKEFEMSRLISFSNDIVPSVMPFIHKSVQNYDLSYSPAVLVINTSFLVNFSISNAFNILAFNVTTDLCSFPNHLSLFDFLNMTG
ncbi:cytochrome P450 CYP72A219-like [Olea europaea subsp. europaea]|uniref:Cytochrome P450 CYP72A219-like n=1 Tax=Olea europaea subsp. europaea TaxID=158383 RepID=A0A8S0UIF6_OLEEU|nr:cytochrome P450 CYP72A219-like [Olea europaea subsp. europaea]